jgi:hypothetical protein
MKKILPLLLLTICLHSYAHLKYIHLEKINASGAYNGQINFISNNLSCFDHWAPDWNYPVKKDSIIRQLKDCYTLFSGKQAVDLETALLLGEIAHYLYNLDVQDYYEKAESWYLKATTLAENDYRGYWFLANHYAASAVQDKSVVFFAKAQLRLPIEVPADFWSEYAYAMLLASMPSHCGMALDQAKKISGRSNYIDQLDNLLQQRWMSVDTDSSYKREDLWQLAERGKQMTFISRPLGIRMSIDSSWEIRFPPYEHHQTAVVLKPAGAAGKKGRPIDYSIAILFKVAAPGESLEAYISNITNGQGQLTPDPLPTSYKNAVSYSIRNPKMYPGWGGGHFHVIGIERTAPEYPGLLLEQPSNIPMEDGGKVNYYVQTQQRKRFKGRIFYVLLLDTCEDIHDASFEVFQRLIKQQMVID